MRFKTKRLRKTISTKINICTFLVEYPSYRFRLAGEKSSVSADYVHEVMQSSKLYGNGLRLFGFTTKISIVSLFVMQTALGTGLGFSIIIHGIAGNEMIHNYHLNIGLINDEVNTANISDAKLNLSFSTPCVITLDK